MVPMNIPTKVRGLKYLYYGITAIALAVQVLLASISLIILRHSLRIIHDKGDSADQEISKDFKLAIWSAPSRVHQHSG